jgi:hypothetical protein
MTATNTKMGITTEIKATESAKACVQAFIELRHARFRCHSDLSVVLCSDVQAFRYCNIPQNILIMYNCRYHGGMQ